MNPNEISDPDFRLLGEQIANAMEYYHVPGVAVGVLRDGEEFTAGFGITNFDHPLPIDADTLFQIGSTTKTFTATLAMRLVERFARRVLARRGRKNCVVSIWE
jgi:CubicO group peptidase (beta-lactamase class C family)